MNQDARRSLAALHPRRVDVPVLLLSAIGLLVAGLSLPVLHTEKMLFWKDDYSIWAGIVNLYENKYYGLAALILFFSMVFPLAKLAALGVIWFVPFGGPKRAKLLWWLKALGRWSMLDVFVVAILVVITKAGGLLEAEPRIGIYLFAGAIFASLIVTVLVDRIADAS